MKAKANEPKKYTLVQVLVMWAWNNHAKFAPLLYHKKLHRMMKQILKQAITDARIMGEDEFNELYGFKP